MYLSVTKPVWPTSLERGSSYRFHSGPTAYSDNPTRSFFYLCVEINYIPSSIQNPVSILTMTRMRMLFKLYPEDFH